MKERFNKKFEKKFNEKVMEKMSAGSDNLIRLFYNHRLHLTLKYGRKFIYDQNRNYFNMQKPTVNNICPE